MQTVNPYFINVLLAPLAGLADDVDAVNHFNNLDPNDEPSVKKIIRSLIVPYSKDLSTQCVDRVRLAYMYYLSIEKLNFERVFESVLPPFDPPDDPRKFFVWIWDECFPGEPFRIEKAEDYKVKVDINEPLDF
jgi:hypothetical protein